MEDIENTGREFDDVIRACKSVFLAKMRDYGSSWRVLRPSSLTDQIYIKANRICSIEAKGTQKISEGIKPEYIGIINYSVIALIQIELDPGTDFDMGIEECERLYDKYITIAKGLMLDKNHDYGDVWRNMRLSSLTDIILMKLKRIKQIEDNSGKTFVSEGVDSNYYDIINYSVFALIKIVNNE
jgi:Nucleotide modification associated domain 1